MKIVVRIMFLLGFFLVLIISVASYYIFKDFSPGNYNAGTDDNINFPTESFSEKTDVNVVPGEFIVKYKKDKINLQSSMVAPKLWMFMSRHEVTDIDADLTSNIQLFKTERDVDEIIQELKIDENVEFVQPNYVYRYSSIITNDPDKDKLWGLHNSGQVIEGNPSVPDADIDAPEAWTINEGSNSEIIVAVIDTGVAYNHPDLIANMWNGQNCKNENNQTLGGCMHGYDFEDNDKIPVPTNSSHGTHIAGTIAAVKNNNFGIIGVAPKAKIMAIKTSLSSINVIKSINFAKYNGAKVINASFGGFGYDFAMKQAIESFPGLFIAAAGNSEKDHNVINSYPCDFDSANIICVAATDPNDEMADFSDFGLSHVDVAAPGVSIYSSVSHEKLLDEKFDEAIAPALPTGWVVGGTSPKWGTFFVGDPLMNLLITESVSPPYTNLADNYLTSPEVNLNENNASLSFLAVCDTEYTLGTSWDNIELQMSADGTTFESIPFPGIPSITFRWNEKVLDTLVGDTGTLGAAQYYFDSVPVPQKFLTENMKLRFLWKTNSTDNVYLGCLIENLEIAHYSDGASNQYEFLQGTSMATPHVVGLAGLVWGYKPNLTTTQMKSVILETGDSLSALSGKIVTGKRINAHKAMIRAGEIGNTTPSNTPTPTNTATTIPTVSNPSSTPVTNPSVTPTPSPRLSITPTIVTPTSPTSIVCGPADLDGNGKFGLYDFSNFAKKYKVSCTDSNQYYGPCAGIDHDRDGKVTISDFSSFARRYYPLQSCAL